MFVLDYPRWEEQPLCWLTPQDQLQLQAEATEHRYHTGQILWSTALPGYHFQILAGQVRLRQAGRSQSVAVLKPGDWFGDALQLSGPIRAVASDPEVVVLRWSMASWEAVTNGQIEGFWQQQRQRFQHRDPDDWWPVADYPYLGSPASAAAAVAMAAAYLQCPVPLEQVQRQLRRPTPIQVVQVAEKLGLQVQAVQVDWSDLQRLSFPVLLQWQTPERLDWVVAYGLEGNRLVIGHPTHPDQTCHSVSQSLVEQHWDGQLWTVALTQTQERFNLGWFLPAIWQYRTLFTEVLVASISLQLLGLATPILTQKIIDHALEHSSVATLNTLVVALFGVAIFEAGLGILRLFIFTHTSNRLDLKLSAQLFRHMLRLPLNYFEARRVGDTVARVQELENIRQFLTGTALTVVLDSLFSVVYLVIMFWYSRVLTAVALAVIPLFAGLSLVVTPLLRRWLNETFNRSADSQSFLVETVTGIHAVKAHGAEYSARQRWEGLFARYIRTSFRASTASNVGQNLGQFLTNFSYLLILWMGAKLVMDPNLDPPFTVGALVAFQMLSARVTGPLLRLVELWQEFQRVMLSVDRLGDILNMPPEAEPGTGILLPQLQGRVQFDQVCFRYQPGLEPVLKGISFTAEPGMLVGVVGRSGSGKSTLSKLLQRLYEPESGRILLDQVELKTADIASVREQIGVVLQDDYLFNGTVADNIALNYPSMEMEQIVAAAERAVAHEFICNLPGGYESQIGERGVSLSGGQQQRLALSRIFLSQAPILILDEATTGLDSETEQRVLQHLRQFAQNRTVFMIAHRFEPLKQADLILVLERGVIVERGTHADLLSQGGVYQTLYQGQSMSIQTDIPLGV